MDCQSYGVWNQIHSANGQFDRARAIGMLEAGMSARDVTTHLPTARINHQQAQTSCKRHKNLCFFFFCQVYTYNINCVENNYGESHKQLFYFSPFDKTI